jgi:uncharacterized protein (DUF983 family)
MTTQTTGKPAARDVGRAAWRGLRNRCPNCGEGRLFRSFLKVNDHCPVCNEALYHERAHDAPPYVVITIVGHIVVGGVLFMERHYALATWIQTAIWVPMTIVLCLLFLPPVKGALIGVQWALRMHGFDPNSPESLEGPHVAAPAVARTR